MRLLIADDETDMTRALRVLLEHEQYTADTVSDGAAALDCALTRAYDGLILDIMMPKMDGLTVLCRLRENRVKTPVLLLTAKGQSEDIITGLDQGADDYLAKPFDPGEFLARVRALTRRGAAQSAPVLTAGSLCFDRASQELSCNGACVCLNGREGALMELLLCRQGQILSPGQILEHVWGRRTDSGRGQTPAGDAKTMEEEAQLLWTYLSYLQKKLSAIGSDAAIVRRAGGIILDPAAARA